MGKSTISMVIFNSYVKLPEGKTSSKIHVDWQRTLATEPDTVARCWEHFGNMLQQERLHRCDLLKVSSRECTGYPRRLKFQGDLSLLDETW